jgi:predicted permease
LKGEKIMLNNLLSKLSKPVALVLLISCFVFFNSNCYSQQTDSWDTSNQVGNDDASYTWLYITLGVLAAGAITYFIVKPSSTDDSSAQNKKEPKDTGVKTDSTKSKTDTTEVKKVIETDK